MTLRAFLVCCGIQDNNLRLSWCQLIAEFRIFAIDEIFVDCHLSSIIRVLLQLSNVALDTASHHRRSLIDEVVL
jgi:hypothetical protein